MPPAHAIACLRPFAPNPPPTCPTAHALTHPPRTRRVQALAKMADIEKELMSSNHELTSLKEELPEIKTLNEQLVHKVETSNDPALTNKMLRRISYDLRHEIVHR